MNAADNIDEWPADMLLEGYEGWRDYHDKKWHDEPATEKQLTALARRGWVAPDGTTKGEANYVLRHPSRKMLRVLTRRDLWRPGDPLPSMADASDMVGRIAQQEGWSR